MSALAPEAGDSATPSAADGRREQLLEAALSVIAERGFPETRIADVAASAARYKAALAKERERLVVPADPSLVSGLAKRYSSKELGELAVSSQNGVTTFDFGEWKSTVASRKNDDGTISFITIDPTNDGFEFVVGNRAGKRVLVIRDGQHEYIFTEVT